LVNSLQLDDELANFSLSSFFLERVLLLLPLGCEQDLQVYEEKGKSNHSLTSLSLITLEIRQMCDELDEGKKVHGLWWISSSLELVISNPPFAMLVKAFLLAFLSFFFCLHLAFMRGQSSM
jgi:hypothetical protein